MRRGDRFDRAARGLDLGSGVQRGGLLACVDKSRGEFVSGSAAE